MPGFSRSSSRFPLSIVPVTGGREREIQREIEREERVMHSTTAHVSYSWYTEPVQTPTTEYSCSTPITGCSVPTPGLPSPHTHTHTHTHTFLKGTQGVNDILWPPYPRTESECAGAFVGAWGLLATRMRHLIDGATGSFVGTLQMVVALEFRVRAVEGLGQFSLLAQTLARSADELSE